MLLNCQIKTLTAGVLSAAALTPAHIHCFDSIEEGEAQSCT